jgi:hypothetical protein
MANAEQVAHEVALLQQAVKRLGEKNADGKFQCSYGKLFDETQDVFEALMGTLKAAKKQGAVSFQGQILLKGAHDKVPIVLEKEAPE